MLDKTKKVTQTKVSSYIESGEKMQELNQYLSYARNEALALGHCYVGSQHFLLSLLHHHPIFANMMNAYHLNYLSLRSEVKQLFAPQKSSYPMEITLQLDRLSQYESFDEMIISFLKESCSVSHELLARHGIVSEQLALNYQTYFHR